MMPGQPAHDACGANSDGARRRQMREEPEPCTLRPSSGRFFDGRKDVGIMEDGSAGRPGEFQVVYQVQTDPVIGRATTGGTEAWRARGRFLGEVPAPRGGRALEATESAGGLEVRAALSLPVQASLAAIVDALESGWPPDVAVRIVHVELPSRLEEHLPGPRYGVPELRRRFATRFRPLLLAAVDGVSDDLDDWGAALRVQWLAGIDILVEGRGEDTADGSETMRRLERAGLEASRIALDTPRRPLYAARLFPSGRDLVAQAERLRDAGAEALVVEWTVSDLDALAAVARLPDSPVIVAMAKPREAPAATPAVLAPAVLFGELVRAAGADVSGYDIAAPEGRAAPLAATDQASVGEALAASGFRRAAWPAPSFGIHPGILPSLVRELGPDIVIDASVAIHGHPGGPRAGAAAFTQALDRLSGYVGPLPDELAQALARWGGAA